MNKHLFAAAALATFALPALAQLPTKEPAKPAVAASGPVATVNGIVIPRQRFDTVMRQQIARGAPDNEQVRAQVRDLLINNEMLVQEANRTGVAKKAEVQQQLDLARQEILANTVVADYLQKHPVADGEIQKEYDRAKAQTGDKEYRARHILVSSEDDAKSVLADLKKGAKFEEIAQKKSLDEGTRPKGGDLDWNVPSNFDKAFSDAMVKLEKGKMTDAPVRSRFGYHVIQLDDVRPVNFPALNQVKQQLQQRLQQQRVETLLRELRAKAKVE